MQGDFNTSLETSGKVTTELTFPKETENFMTWLAENPKLSQHGLTVFNADIFSQQEKLRKKITENFSHTKTLMARETYKIYDQIGRSCPEILWISLTSSLDRVLGNLLRVQAWAGVWSRWTQRCLPTQPFWDPEITADVKLPLFHQLPQPYPFIAAEVVDIVAWTQLHCLSCMVTERQGNEKSPISGISQPQL